jgi:hypothetical protein
MTKETLIAAAEASKLADAPIQGNTNTWAAARGPGKWYDGWSNIKVCYIVISMLHFNLS